jgi:hypothetical protein
MEKKRVVWHGLWGLWLASVVLAGQGGAGPGLIHRRPELSRRQQRQSARRGRGRRFLGGPHRMGTGHAWCVVSFAYKV